MDSLRIWAPALASVCSFVLAAYLGLYMSRRNRAEDAAKEERKLARERAEREHEREQRETDTAIEECRRKLAAAFEKIDGNRGQCETVRHDMSDRIQAAVREIEKRIGDRDREHLLALGEIKTKIDVLAALSRRDRNHES